MTVYERASLKINIGEDRLALVSILARAGYIVKIDERPKWPNPSDFYVVAYVEDYQYTNE